MKSETDYRFKAMEKDIKRNKALFMRLGVAVIAAAAIAMSSKAKGAPKETPVMTVKKIETPVEAPRNDTEIPNRVINFTPVLKTSEDVDPEESVTIEESMATEEPVVEEPTATEDPATTEEPVAAIEELVAEEPASERPYTDPADIVEPDFSELVSPIPALGWDGPVLTPDSGHIDGPTGDETYYNLPMDYVVGRMRRMGNEDSYWIRQDGVKMLGNYVMVAANLNIHPRGSIVETSLGTGIVCDTGGFAKDHPQRLDIATVWEDPRDK